MHSRGEVVSGGGDDDAALGRTEDWGIKGRRAISVGLGGWEYNPVVRIAKETSITIPINNNPFPVGPPPHVNTDLFVPIGPPHFLILAGVFPFNAAPLSQFIEPSQAKMLILAWVFPFNAAPLSQFIELSQVKMSILALIFVNRARAIKAGK